jgi:hypothetical protein
LQVDITFQWRSCRSEDTLPSPAHHFPGFERAASGAIYRRSLARGGRIVVDNSTAASTLAAFAKDLSVSLCVTTLDSARLPRYIKAELYSDSLTFGLPRLRLRPDSEASAKPKTPSSRA